MRIHFFYVNKANLQPLLKHKIKMLVTIINTLIVGCQGNFTYSPNFLLDKYVLVTFQEWVLHSQTS